MRSGTRSFSLSPETIRLPCGNSIRGEGRGEGLMCVVFCQRLEAR